MSPMQLRGVPRRQVGMSIPPRPWRALLSLGFALAVAAVPVSQAVACSCGMGETADVIRAAQLAFIGTVADQRDTGVQSEFSGELREYSFMVARSNVPTDAVTRIVAGTSDPSCGIVFGNDEEWLIVARRTPAGLETNLCSGNLLMTDLGAVDRAAIADLLPAAGPSTAPEEPAEAPTEPSDTPAGSGAASPEATDLAIPLVVGGLAILLLAGAGLRGLSRRRATPRP